MSTRLKIDMMSTMRADKERDVSDYYGERTDHGKEIDPRKYSPARDCLQIKVSV